MLKRHFEIEICVEIIVAMHAVVRNNREPSCTLYPVSPKGNIFQNQYIVKTRVLTLIIATNLTQIFPVIFVGVCVWVWYPGKSCSWSIIPIRVISNSTWLLAAKNLKWKGGMIIFLTLKGVPERALVYIPINRNLHYCQAGSQGHLKTAFMESYICFNSCLPQNI